MDGADRTATTQRDRRAIAATSPAGFQRPRTISRTRNRAAIQDPSSPLRIIADRPAHAAVKPMRPGLLRRTQMLADAGVVASGFVLTVTLPGGLRDPLESRVETALAGALSVVCWLLAMGVSRLYVARVIARPSEELRRLVLAGFAAASTLVLASFIAGIDAPTRPTLGALLGIVTVLLAIERRISRYVFNRLRASGRMVRRIAIIGTDVHAIDLADSVTSNPTLGYHVVGFIGDDLYPRRHGRRVLGTIDHAGALLRDHRCGGAMISLNSVDTVDVNRLTRDLTDDGLHVALSTGLRDIDITRMRPQGLDGQTLIYVEPTIRTGWRSSAKRMFDLFVAGAGIVLTAPLLAIAAVLIKAESSGPVFFRQERVGRDGEVFKMIKLRSMYQDAEAHRVELMARNESDGPLFKIRNDPRVTRAGRVLRKLSIDEFPQFWNVIRGEMSVVGPRPALPSEVQGWDDELHDRLRVLPGITGMWQVSGRADTSFDAYKRLDLYYVDNWSLLHDLRIVMRTFLVLVTRRGAS
jgi:exopolysaccharide biosynthesis polyprenyl glycosylphosphotransferase